MNDKKKKSNKISIYLLKEEVEMLRSDALELDKSIEKFKID